MAAELYRKVLQLAGEVAYYEGLTSSKENNPDLNGRTACSGIEQEEKNLLLEKVAELQTELALSRQAESRSAETSKELEETASKLTEWNGILEAKIKSREDEALKAENRAIISTGELEKQLIEVTKKRISLQQAYMKLEDKHLKKTLILNNLETEMLELREENITLRMRLNIADPGNVCKSLSSKQESKTRLLSHSPNEEYELTGIKRTVNGCDILEHPTAATSYNDSLGHMPM